MVDESSHDPEPFFKPLFEPTDLTNASSWIWNIYVEKNKFHLSRWNINHQAPKFLKTERKKVSFIQKDSFLRVNLFFCGVFPAPPSIDGSFAANSLYHFVSILRGSCHIACRRASKQRWKKISMLFLTKMGDAEMLVLNSCKNEVIPFMEKCLLAPAVIHNWPISGC